MIKTQLLQYLLTAIGLTGIVGVGLYYGTIDPKTEFPSPISVDGQVIEFTWTDDNSDEDLHIFTDKATYDQGLSEATVYVAVQNNTNKAQNVELQPFFRDSSKEITNVSILSQITRNIYTPVMEENCAPNPIKKATTTLCIQKQVSTTTTQEVIAKWVPLEIVERTTAEILKEATWSSKTTFAEKQVENFVAENKTKSFPVEAGEVIYYKVNIKFPANADDNFYFVAKGSEGGYGHLDPWFNSSWLYKIKLEVNPDKVPGSANLTNYPVYLNLANLSSDFHTNVKSDGCDIRIVESDDTTETPFELVAYDSATDTGELHFKADSLSYNATTTFYVYYGNSGASCYAETDTYGRNNTWNSVYVGVWHMNEWSSGSSAVTRNDAKGSNNLTDNNTTAAGVGKVGSTSADMEISNNERLNILDASQTGLDVTGNLTISLWHKPESLATTQYLVAKWNHSTQNQYMYYVDGTNFTFYVDNACSGFTYKGGAKAHGGLTNGTWYREAVVYTAAAASAEMFLDNSSLGTITALETSIANCTADFQVGGRTSSPSSNTVDGLVDEVRVAASALSTDWLSAEYNNQSSPSTFYYLGAQETNSGGGGVKRQTEFYFE